MVTLRSALVTATVAVHNDERHYALDGFWVKSGLSFPMIWNELLRGHLHPHVLYHPRTGEVKRHGDFAKGFNKAKDDLATFPRAGHPPLYMVILGGVFSLFSKAWLLDSGHYVVVARVLNTALDCLTWLMLYQILRQLFGAPASLRVLVPVVLMPYVLVIGSIGYLDSPGAFMIVLCVWIYILRVRKSASTGWWVLLGLFVGLGILMKQSNIFAFPLLAATAWIWPPAQNMRALIFPLTLLVAAAALPVLVGSNPRDLVTVTMSTVESTRQYGENRFVARDGLKRVIYLANPSRHYHFSVTPKRSKPMVRSRVLAGLHYASFPLLLAGFIVSIIVLASLGRWRALGLPLIIILIAVSIPVGSCVRRLYLLLPFVMLTMALAISCCSKRRRKIGPGSGADSWSTGPRPMG